MKKIIAIITIGASVAFLQVQAQEAQQTERTQNASDVTNPAPEASVAQEKVEIDQSELPQPIMESFKKSEYRDMSIVNVYEVSDPQAGDANAYQSMSDASSSDGSAMTDKGTAKKTQEPTAQADRALDSAVYQSGEPSETAAMKEKVAEEHKEAVGETETPEQREESGRTMTAEGQDSQMTDDELAEKGKELYEGNKYDNFTEATNDAYAEVAKEEVDDAKGKKYELQVKGDNEAVTLTYDENGELVKADKGAM